MRISVAVATYNGEKYIKEQLLSIIQQTVLPDEIVISDDGSNDSTLFLIDSIIKKNTNIKINLLTNNPKHGACGNFEWALSHTTGDIIFLADQDDIWEPVKIERVYEQFVKVPTAMCIFHNAGFIDGDGTILNGHILHEFDHCHAEELYKLEQSVYLERVVSDFSVNGMVQCISKELLTKALPFPSIRAQHDKWLLFCALCNNECYCLNDVLAYYRLHSAQINGTGRNNAKFFQKISRGLRSIKKAKFNNDVYELSSAFADKIETYELENKRALSNVRYSLALGEKKNEIRKLNKLKGVIRLITLYQTNPLYHSDGIKALIIDAVGLLKN